MYVNIVCYVLTLRRYQAVFGPHECQGRLSKIAATQGCIKDDIPHFGIFQLVSPIFNHISSRRPHRATNNTQTLHSNFLYSFISMHSFRALIGGILVTAATVLALPTGNVVRLDNNLRPCA